MVCIYCIYIYRINIEKLYKYFIYSFYNYFFSFFFIGFIYDMEFSREVMNLSLCVLDDKGIYLSRVCRDFYIIFFSIFFFFIIFPRTGKLRK